MRLILSRLISHVYVLGFVDWLRYIALTSNVFNETWVLIRTSVVFCFVSTKLGNNVDQKCNK
jgi:hypothetical protein